MATTTLERPPVPQRPYTFAEWAEREIIRKPSTIVGMMLLVALNLILLSRLVRAAPVVATGVTFVWLLFAVLIATSLLRTGTLRGVLRPVRDGFFQSVNSGLLTLLLSLLAAAFVVAVLRWVVNTAQWEAITRNATLLAVGRYDRTQLWRPGALLAIVVALGAVSALAYGPLRARVPEAVRGALPLLWLALIPFSYWFLGAPLLGHPRVQTDLWGGLMLTLQLSVTAIVVSFPFGVLLALGRRSQLPVVRAFCIAFIEFWRGVPLITVLFTANFMLPLLLPPGSNPNGLLRVLVALIIFSAAYLAENVRGGLQSIPRGQYEAAQALGLSAFRRTYHIILPQALRAVIPAIVGQFIGLIKDTTLVSLVGLFDLLGIGKAILAQAEFLGAQQEVYVFLFVVFWVICYPLAVASRRLERSLGIGKR